jgi:hypothetical protein
MDVNNSGDRRWTVQTSDDDCVVAHPQELSMNKKSVLLITLICIISCLACLLYPLWLGGGSLQPVLPASLVPTAVFLVENPLPTPIFVSYVYPPPGDTIQYPVRTRICIGILTAGLSDSGDPGQKWAANNAQVFVNDRRLAWDDVRVSLLAIMARLDDGRTSARFDVCISPALERGLHIVEIRTSPEPLGILGIGEMYSYTWAYRVEWFARSPTTPPGA